MALCAHLTPLTERYADAHARRDLPELAAYTVESTFEEDADFDEPAKPPVYLAVVDACGALATWLPQSPRRWRGRLHGLALCR